MPRSDARYIVCFGMCVSVCLIVYLSYFFISLSQLREDELKMRLRSKSARVRGRAPTSSTEEDEDAGFTRVEPLQSPLTPEPPDTPLRSLVPREPAEGGESVREAGGDGRESKEEMGRGEGREEEGASGDNRGEGAERASEDGDREEEEELTQVEELNNDKLLIASGELESDSSFLHAEDKEEIF